MMACHHSKFGLIWMKESKVTRGGGGLDPHPQVKNVLNCPGEIGLKIKKKILRDSTNFSFGELNKTFIL